MSALIGANRECLYFMKDWADKDFFSSVSGERQATLLQGKQGHRRYHLLQPCMSLDVTDFCSEITNRPGCR